MDKFEKRITKGLTKGKFTNAKAQQRKEDKIARGIDRFPTYPDLVIHGKKWVPTRLRGA